MLFKITIIFIAVSLVSVNAAPVEQLAATGEQPATTVLKYEYEPNANSDGGYRLEYELSDGQSRSEVGTIKYVGEENTPVLSVSGYYSYVAPDGVTYTLRFLADENGFSPNGDHLPGTSTGLPPNEISTLL